MEKLHRELRSWQKATLAQADSWHAVIEEVISKILKSSVRSQELTRRELFIGALRGIMDSVDPYAQFLYDEEAERRGQAEEGLHRGFGLRLLKTDPQQTLIVARVDKNGPAFRSGLRTGDRVLTLDGVSTKNHSFELVRSLVRTSPGELHLLVLRSGWAEPRRFLVERSDYPVPYVKVRHLPRGVVFVRIERFGRGTADDFAAVLERLAEREVSGLVLDLRDNPGGFRGEAVRSVDLLVGRDLGLPIVVFRRAGGDEQPQMPDVEPAYRGPLAVLVNRGSASASELVAAAIQDMGRGPVVGQRTFGKGFEQSTIPLSKAARDVLGPDARIRFSTREILRPLEQSLEAGVIPNFIVESYSPSWKSAHEHYRVTFTAEADAFIFRNLDVATKRYEEGNLWDPEEAAEFTHLYAALNTSLSPQEVRRALQARILLHIEDLSGKEFIGEYTNDPPLQRAILEVLLQSGHTPLDIPFEYRKLFDDHFRNASEESTRE